MSLDVKSRLLELDYEWDDINRIHKLSWDTDYPVNITGCFLKTFLPYHEFTVGDKVTINDETYAFTDLKSLPARTNSFVANQYVPIVIDMDEKKICYFSPSGAGTGSGEVINLVIQENDWTNNQYLVRVSDMSTDMIVVLDKKPTYTDEQVKKVLSYGIDGKIVAEGVLLTAAVQPTQTIELQLILL
ncbi:MAG: hypothetical protein J6Y02_24070 [Pseudobutyrivibrio sp.]|nr:hypothetical protein [Pseudobutyrivibrio sp.]